jgi:hypothetical protein
LFALPPSRETVEAALRTFVLEALELARGSGVVPGTKTIYSRVDTEGGTTTEREVVPDAPSVFEGRGALREQIVQLPGLDAAANSLLEFKGTEMVSKRWLDADREMRLRLTARDFALRLLFLSCANDRFEIDDDKWARQTDRLWLLLETGLSEKTTVAWVAGVHVDAPLDLGGVLLRPLSGVERCEIDFWSRHHDARLAIEISGQAADDDQTFGAGRHQLIGDVTAALRLWTGSRIVIQYIRTMGDWPTGVGGGPLYETGWTPISRRLDDPGGFVRFWREVRSSIAHPTGGVRVALDRFKIMHESPRGEDRVLDQVIILEALFLKKAEKQELGYRLRMRLAHFLGETFSERVQLEKLFKDAYAVRSKIAHGAALEAKDHAIQQQLDSATNRALRKILVEAARRRMEGIEETICDEMDARLLERKGD